MKIGSKITALLNPGRGDAADLLRQLRPGQVVHAKVIDSPRAGIARLQIGLTELLAKTQVPLQRGTPLTLSVARVGHTPELQVLTATGALHPEQYLLRKALPQQVSMGESLSALGRALRNAGGELPSAFREDAQRLLNRITEPASLNASQVKDQLLNSGLFFETLLARRRRPARGDMKLELMLLLRGLQALLASKQDGEFEPNAAQHPPSSTNVAAGSAADQRLERLLQILNGALARINTQQAASLVQELPERSTWQFDLPLWVNGQLEEVLLRVERDKTATRRRGQPEDTRWNATLRFDFAGMGWVQVDLRLQRNRVGSTFWCERASTEQRIGAQLPRLERAMIGAGLQVDTLAVRHGEPPNQPGLPTPGEALIDDHA